MDFWTPELFALVRDYLQDPSSAGHRLENLKAGISHPSMKITKQQEYGARVIERIIINISDQLLLMGLAVLIAGFWTHCSISVYHFALVSDLAWLASNCHLITLAALEKYLRRRGTIRDWRVLLMTCMAILLAASTVMQGHRVWYESWPYNAQCVFENYVFPDVGGSPARWMYTKLVILFIDYPSSIGLLYQPSRDVWTRWLYTKPRELLERVIDGLVARKGTPLPHTNTAKGLLCSAALNLVKISRVAWSVVYVLLTTVLTSRWINLVFCFATFIYGLVSLFQDKNIPRWKMDADENIMSFGQMVPILLLFSTFFVAKEAYVGEYQRVNHRYTPLIRMTDVGIEMRNEELGIGSTSMTDLLHGGSTAAPVSSGGRGLEKGSSVHDSDNATTARPSPRRLDTEMGGRTQASELGPAPPPMGPRRRSAFARLTESQTT